MQRGADRLMEALLRSAEGASYLSGEALSAGLGITRSALWKRINALRRKGFNIEAERGKGYRLVSPADLSAEEIRAAVHGPLGKEAVFLNATGSTNDDAMRLAAGGAAHGAVVVAETQHNGRGRLGRRWLSPAGDNIYMSVILRPAIAPREAGLLTLMASMASASVLAGHTGLDVKIKWPNDIMVSGRKLGGVLAEMRSEPGRIVYAVVGVGVNVNMPSSAIPLDIRPLATSVIEETGRRYRRTPIVAGILDALGRELESFERAGRASLLERWRSVCCTLGERVRVVEGRETLTGTALDIDDEGRLVLETPGGGVRRLSAGDVAVLRQ